ncbi:sensor histidine kinase [Brevibacterium salitolerans]|uniref:histidine kinase n=1 Tax=Brevibacterium salitolerans TaxID=1403566 RepID=A0ABP5I7F2_9MICO
MGRNGTDTSAGSRRTRAWWRTPSPWKELLGYVTVAVLSAAFGFRTWDLFSLLPEPVSSWWTLAPGLPACALVLTKRRAPVASLIAATAFFVLDLLTTSGLITFILVLDLLYTAAVALPAGRRSRLLGAVAAGTAVIAASAYALTRDAGFTVAIGLQMGAVLGTGYWYGTAVAQSQELVELHRRRAEDAALLAERDRVEAVQREREHMARELHDVVAGHVSAVAIRSEAALSVGDSEEPSPERRALHAVRDASLDAHTALRSMIAVLRAGGEGLVTPPGRETVPELAAQARSSGVEVAVDDRVGEALPAPVDHAVGRIVQEALANAVRHAAGSSVQVRMERKEDGVHVTVTSRGGAPLRRPELSGSGLGLELLGERARALGGTLTAGALQTGPEAGDWEVRAVLPLDVTV